MGVENRAIGDSKLNDSPVQVSSACSIEYVQVV